MNTTLNETSNAHCNILDVKRTIEAHGLGNITRVHGGTDNEDTLAELLEDLLLFIEAKLSEKEST